MFDYLRKKVNKYIELKNKNRNKKENKYNDSDFIKNVRRETYENRKLKFNETVVEITIRIEDAAKKGKCYIEYSCYHPLANEWLIKEIKRHFEELGFRVKFDEICECIEVSW